MTVHFDASAAEPTELAILDLAARVALDLQPDLPPGGVLTGSAELTTIADEGLADGGDQVLGISARHRVSGLVLAAWEAGRIVLPPVLVDRLVDQHTADLRRCLVIERLLGEVSELFVAAAVDPVVVKGVASAHLDYPDPAWRVFQDVDLLVPSHQIDSAVRALESAGFTRDLPPRTTSWDRRFAKDLTFVGRLGPECDLHRTLVPGAFGFWLDLDQLIADSIEFEVAGRRHRALDLPGRLLHAALALTVGEAEPKFGHVLDFALVLRMIDDVATVQRLAERSRVEILLAESAALCHRVLERVLTDDPPLSGRLDQLRSGVKARRVERAALRTYRSSGGSNTATLLGALLALPRVVDRLAYTRGLVVPDRRYRHARRRSARPPEWRTGLRELVRRGRA